jgi:SAM-dependent methyltransferase
MDQFKSAHDSHQHSLKILNLLYEYDDFMDSVGIVADMGCGAGMDTAWWAQTTTRDNPPIPHNYICMAVDQNPERVEQSVRDLPNVRVISSNFEVMCLPRTVDLMWSHDSFQYAVNPVHTLGVWNQQMNTDGMLVISVPSTQGYEYNRFRSRGYTGCFHNYTVINLMYQLAVNGFDCRDGYFLKQANDPWINVVVYKNQPPLDYNNTSWWDLAENNLLPDSVIASLERYGHVRQEDLLVRWLDKEYYQVKD